MADTACHAIDGVEDRGSGDGGMIGAQSLNTKVRRERGVMSRRVWNDQCLGESYTAAACRWLQGDVNIL